MRKQNKTYYFSVEGETERWYLEWLQNAINDTPESKYNVKFDCKVQKDPLSRAKGMNIIAKTEITHIFDRESEEAVHVKRFQETLDRMKAAQNIGKQITYRLGYCNFTFELWMILHKVECNGKLTHRDQYLAPLTRAYNENFETLEQYKHEENFKRILKKLSISDVLDAVNRAGQIMQNNEESGYVLREYKGYRFYKENPSLTIGEIIGKIMAECGLN